MRCGNDPVVCLDFLILFIGEFLKDRITMTLLAALLVLLFKLRVDQRKSRELAYAEQLIELDKKRKQERKLSSTWEVVDGKWVERP